MSDVPNLGEKIPRSGADVVYHLTLIRHQSHHVTDDAGHGLLNDAIVIKESMCWASADSISRLVTGYMYEVLQYGICR